MGKTIITSGRVFTDIDALACALSLGELFAKQNLPAEVVLSGPLNETVISTIKSWPLTFSTRLSSEATGFILVDLSDPSYFSDWVVQNKIIGLYDHHFGFEKYWREKLGNKAKIEAVGACATLIWEEFVSKKISPSILIANLLYTAIFANTLNFQASVSTERDKRAFEQVRKFTQLSPDWPEIYYSELARAVFANPREAIIKDTKVVTNKAGEKMAIGQIELWSGKKFITRFQKQISEVLESFGYKTWFLTLPSISEGKNYLFTQSEAAKKLLIRLLKIKFIGDIATTDKLYLRKELLKKLQKLQQTCFKTSTPRLV